MPYTSDSTFTGQKVRPFSADFANKLKGMAADLSALNTALPSLQYALQLIDPTGSSSPVFPAEIFGGSHPNYMWVETAGPDTFETKQNGRNSYDLGGAANTLEVGLSDEFIPPGLHSGCLDGIDGSYTVEPVIASIVMMSSAYSPVENKIKYYFSVPVALCPQCNSSGFTSGTLSIDMDNPPDPEFTKQTGRVFADGRDGVISGDTPEGKEMFRKIAYKNRAALGRGEEMPTRPHRTGITGPQPPRSGPYGEDV